MPHSSHRCGGCGFHWSPAHSRRMSHITSCVSHQCLPQPHPQGSQAAPVDKARPQEGAHPQEVGLSDRAWRTAEEPGAGAEGAEHLPAVSGPSAEARPHGVLMRGCAGPERRGNCPGPHGRQAAAPGLRPTRGLQRVARLNTQPLPASRARSSLSLWLSGQRTGDPAGTWCSTHSTISPPLLHPWRTGGGRPPPGLREAPSTHKRHHT